MAQTITTPVCSVSPQGGGTCTYALGTSGPLTLPGYTGYFQNYVFSATPAQGYHFVRFDISGYYENSDSGRYDYTWTATANPYTTQEDGASFTLDGAAWWWQYEYQGRIYEEWIGEI